MTDSRVAVTFENGERGVFDCRPYFDMGYYKPLNDPAVFKCVRVSYGWLNWPGDIDIGADDVWRESVRTSADDSVLGRKDPATRMSYPRSTCGSFIFPFARPRKTLI